MRDEDKPEVGEFIEIPVWQVTGCVMAVEAAIFDSENSFVVALQEDPEDEEPAQWRKYRLEPGQFTII